MARTPISPEQFDRTQRMMTTAGNILANICNARLNLDPETRDAINRARTELSEAERLLMEQPITE